MNTRIPNSSSTRHFAAESRYERLLGNGGFCNHDPWLAVRCCSPAVVSYRTGNDVPLLFLTALAMMNYTHKAFCLNVSPRAPNFQSRPSYGSYFCLAVLLNTTPVETPSFQTNGRELSFVTPFNRTPNFPTPCRFLTPEFPYHHQPTARPLAAGADISSDLMRSREKERKKERERERERGP